MDSNEKMYELEYPAPKTTDEQNKPLNLVIALHGYADAGYAIAQAGKHLTQALDHANLATFNSDMLVDYRSRRPMVTISHNRVTDIEPLDITLSVVKDTEDRPFLLLSGPEPDLRWNQFTDAVTDLIERFDVKRTVCLYSAPMPVPHTRPMIVTAHGTDAEVNHKYPNFDGLVKVPGSVTLNLEQQLAAKERLTSSFTAHVPQYIAATEYPIATLNLLRAVQDTADVTLPLKVLETESVQLEKQLVDQLEDNVEVNAIVASLEQQYDEEMRRYRQRQEQNLLSPDESLPSGEELGAELEQFLADLNRGDNQSDTDSDDDSSSSNDDASGSDDR